MKYDLDRIVDRKGTNSIKWEFGALLNSKVDGDTIPLWVADMDFACSKPIQDAIKTRVDKEIFGYSAHFTGEYFRAVGSWMQRRFNWYVNSEDIFISPGVVPAISDLIRCFSKEGEGIIIQKPVYYPFMMSIENNKRVIKNNALINNNGYYTMDFDDLEEKAKDPDNTMMVLCSPHNPVGRVWKEEELRRVGEICLSNDVVLVSDEIHFDIVRKNVKHTVLESLFPGEDRIITCTAPSKTFNLAGMHTSHIIIKNEKYKERWNEVVGMGLLSPLSICAVQAAFDESEDWLEQVNDYIDGNIYYIQEFLSKHLPEAKYVPAEGTYLAWIDLEAYGTGGKDLDNRMVEGAKVLLEGGTMFGSEGEYFQRINVACPRSILNECLVRVANTMNKLAISDKVRNFSYNTPWENNIDFNSKLDKKTYLVFLRYFGCTLCQVDIQEYIKRYKEFTDKGAQLFIVLQSTPEIIKENVKKADIPYTIICDPEQELYKLYNLNTAYSEMGMASKKVLVKGIKALNMGVKHGKYEGNELQLPAAFLFNIKGEAEFVQYGTDAADIPDIDEMLEKL
ncbi:MAG: PatB family C-S lyase [Spirochaetales bacterium]|nr:PatB family C-S lyase [Spirochaetales bacterium]